ncbi:MAG: hypothetical protein QW412_01595 [Candidatus Aenigmatarchaeota archaeon]
MEEETKHQSQNRYSKQENIKLSSVILSDISDIKESKKGNKYFLVELEKVRIPFFRKEYKQLENLRNSLNEKIGKQVNISITKTGFGVDVEDASAENIKSETEASVFIPVLKCENCGEYTVVFRFELKEAYSKIKEGIEKLDSLLLKNKSDVNG